MIKCEACKFWVPIRCSTDFLGICVNDEVKFVGKYLWDIDKRMTACGDECHFGKEHKKQLK